MSSLSSLSISSIGFFPSRAIPRSLSLSHSFSPSLFRFSSVSTSLSRSLDLTPSLSFSRSLYLYLSCRLPSRLTRLALYLLSLSPFVPIPFLLAPLPPSPSATFFSVHLLRSLSSFTPRAFPPLDPRHPVFVYLMPFHSLLVSRAPTFSD